MSSLRLASFNLLSGRSLADGLIDTDRLVAAIRELDAGSVGDLGDLGYLGGLDVLAIQEVDRFQPRSGGVDQAALIAATLGAVSSRFVATIEGTPGEQSWTPVADDGSNGTSPGGAAASFGVALISRRPVAEWHVLRMSPPPGRFPLPIPSRPPRLLWLNDEPRAVIAAVLDQPRITIACTHLSFVPFANARQLLRVRRWLEQLPAPRVLLGDLNLPGGLARRITGWTPLVSTATYPSPAPRLQLDHALASGLPDGAWAEGRARRLPISDHQALEVALRLPEPPPAEQPPAEQPAAG